MEKVKSVKKKITIVGGGHIGLALAMGLVRSGAVKGSQLTVSSRRLSKIQHLKKIGIAVTDDNASAVAHADWVFLAVKPKLVGSVLAGLQGSIKKQLIISLAAGVTIKKLKSYAPNVGTFARIMPNIPIAHMSGVVGLFAGTISKTNHAELKEMLQVLGFVLQVKDERELEMLTVVSGSGPATVSFFIDALAHAGRELGLSQSTADALAKNTFKGTSAYMDVENVSAESLMNSVATKGGLTEAILGSLKESSVRRSIARALKVGYVKIKKLRN
ncbi:MAG: pyrroline-5-carboxylate reductase [Parcubacteria group bacterium Greene0714_7]|nr:MAG: pyrroline-5-carboxylate reductase [Parcubacteria group bacterium Greene0714_7]